MALSLGAGFAMTVAIAWGSAGLGPKLKWGAVSPGRAPGREARRPLERFGFSVDDYDVDQTMTTAGWLMRQERVYLWELNPEGLPMGGESIDVYEVGLPLPALEWSDTEWRRVSDRATVSTLERVWEFGLNYDGDRHPMSGGWRSLPVRPCRYGLGLAVNTVVWSVVAWGILTLCGLGRSERRRRRGLCVTCGYPVRDGAGNVMPVCPECGRGAEGGRTG